MNRRTFLKNYLRIIWVIASKDIVDAIKNKSTLSVFLGVLLMMLTSQALPLILGLQESYRLVVVGSENVPLLEKLRERDQFVLVVVDSGDEMARFLRESNYVWLGVQLPAETGMETGKPLQLDGYFGHIVTQGDVDETATNGFGIDGRRCGRQCDGQRQ